jgi:RNA polymerase sigma factor (sigma-70 family)
MIDRTDSQLLADYAAERPETAFAELVRRHVNLVYSAALRMTCNTHAAQDVTQGVFILLGQQARQLRKRPALEGWLHNTARNLAAKHVRSDVRRRSREQEAAVTMKELLSTNPDASWEHIAPYLDEALGSLEEPERKLVVRRKKEFDIREGSKTPTIVGKMSNPQDSRLCSNEKIRKDRLAFQFGGVSAPKSLAGAKCGVRAQVQAHKSS